MLVDGQIEKPKAQIRRASTRWGGEKEARKSAEEDAKKRKAKDRSNTPGSETKGTGLITALKSASGE
jgi:hypothetical protein